MPDQPPVDVAALHATLRSINDPWVELDRAVMLHVLDALAAAEQTELEVADMLSKLIARCEAAEQRAERAEVQGALLNDCNVDLHERLERAARVVAAARACGDALDYAIDYMTAEEQARYDQFRAALAAYATPPQEVR